MITVDSREAQQHPEIPDLLDIPVFIDLLPAADFAFVDRDMEPTGIERSEIGNLVMKLRSGELESQMLKCQENYSSIILLAEGVYDRLDNLLAIYKKGNNGYFRSHVYPNTRYNDIMAMMVRLSEMGIEVIPSPNFECSMELVKVIYHQRTKPEEEHRLFKSVRKINIPVKLSNNPAVPKLMSLTKRFPEKVSIRLINKFGSIWNVIHAKDEELLEVDGFGKGLLQKLKEGIGKE